MATADSLVQELTNLKQLILDENFSQNRQEKQDIAKKIKVMGCIVFVIIHDRLTD